MHVWQCCMASGAARASPWRGRSLEKGAVRGSGTLRCRCGDRGLRAACAVATEAGASEVIASRRPLRCSADARSSEQLKPRLAQRAQCLLRQKDDQGRPCAAGNAANAVILVLSRWSRCLAVAARRPRVVFSAPAGREALSGVLERASRRKVSECRKLGAAHTRVLAARHANGRAHATCNMANRGAAAYMHDEHACT